MTHPDLGELDLEADESVTVLLVVVKRGPVILTGRVASGDVDRRVGQGKDSTGREPRGRGRGEDEVEVEQVGLAMRMRGNRLLISFRAC